MSNPRSVMTAEVIDESLLRFESSVVLNKNNADYLAKFLDEHKEECRIFRGGVYGNGYRLNPDRVLSHILQLYRTKSLSRQYVNDIISSLEFAQLCIDQKAWISPELFEHTLITLKLNPHHLGYMLRVCDSSDIPMLIKMTDLCSKSKHGSKSITMIKKRIVELTASSELTAKADLSAEESRKRAHGDDSHPVKPHHPPTPDDDAQPTTPLYNAAQLAHDQHNDIASIAELANSPASQADSPIITHDAYVAAIPYDQQQSQTVYAAPIHPASYPAASDTNTAQTSTYTQPVNMPSTASPHAQQTYAGSHATSPYAQPVNMPSTASPYAQPVYAGSNATSPYAQTTHVSSTSPYTQPVHDVSYATSTHTNHNTASSYAQPTYAQPTYASSTSPYTQPVHDVSYATSTHTTYNTAPSYAQPTYAPSTSPYMQPVQVSSSSAATSYTQPSHETSHPHTNSTTASLYAQPTHVSSSSAMPRSRQITVSEEDLNTYVNNLLNFYIQHSFAMGASQVAQNINLAVGQILAAGGLHAIENITAALHQPLTKPQPVIVNPASLFSSRNNAAVSGSVTTSADQYYVPRQSGQHPQ